MNQGFREKIEFIPRESMENGCSRVPAFEHTRKQPRILVVDDYEPVRDVLTRVLVRMGTVDTAANGMEALNRARLIPYDLIVTDVDMPVMDGIELYYSAAQEIPGLSGRFLFFTGSPSVASLAFFREHDLPFLTKPAHPHELEQAAAQVLDRNASVPVGTSA